MRNPRPEFPFSAIIGLDELKLALLLNTIDPKVGGVLISGPRGIAKSTLARALVDVLPALPSGDRSPFINMPLGVSEDRVIGTLNLQRVLSDQKVEFEPGLLARANNGVLYIDEVNLLADSLVDIMLDAAARGINVVERDGISHCHDARFILIGTMNPDEGELRPQLVDRFGLCVHLTNSLSVAQRIEIVRQREAYELEPSDYCDRYLHDQQAITQRIVAARAILSKITIEDWVYEHIASSCLEAQVEGVRADVAWHRAAVAHAAWRNSEIVTIEDVDTVAAWVLTHRRAPNSPNSFGGTTPPTPPERKASPNCISSIAKGDAQTSSDSDDGEWGAMQPQHQATVYSRSPTLPALPKSSIKHQFNYLPTLGVRKKGSGKMDGKGKLSFFSRLDWFATLTANKGNWPPRQLTFKRVQPAQPLLHFIMLDTSGSILKNKLFGRAKGLVTQLAQNAYLARQKLAILGFGNNRVEEILSRRKAPKYIGSLLDSHGGGGGTPIREALLKAQQAIKYWQLREPGLRVRTYLITDGRIRQPIGDIGAFQDSIVIDIEESAIKRGRAVNIAHTLNAQYLPLALMESV